MSELTNPTSVLDVPVIQLRNVSKTYAVYAKPLDRLLDSIFPGKVKMTQEFKALSDVSFSIYKGEMLGIIGKNGAGKSTLLQIICGTSCLTSGELMVNGDIAALLELGTGFNPEFTGRENVFMYGMVLGMSYETINTKLKSILQFADIGDYIDQPVKTFSSGMLVRLAFAVSVTREPEVLVVDEALSVGDEAFQRKCFARIGELKKGGTTILFVSHAASLVVELCDRALLIDGGEVLYEGKPKHAVMVYHKLEFCPRDKREEVKAKIVAGQIDVDLDTETVIPDKILSEECDGQLIKAFYDPHLKASSLVSYVSRGALITDPRVETEDGEKVNNLIVGDRYIYKYYVSFDKSVDQIQYGMLIKSVSGFEIGGALLPSVYEYSSRVEAGTKIEVVFEFVCNMNPGVYFLNAGVQGSVDQQSGYVHRIIDALALRVLPQKRSLGTAFVNFDISGKVSYIG